MHSEINPKCPVCGGDEDKCFCDDECESCGA